MVAGKCDWDQQKISLPATDIVLNRITGLGPEPGLGSDLRLPA